MTSSELKFQKESIQEENIYELTQQKEQIIEAMNVINTRKSNRYNRELTAKEERTLDLYQAALDVIEELIEQYESIINTYDNALQLRYFGGLDNRTSK